MKNKFQFRAYLNIAKACFLVGMISAVFPQKLQAEAMPLNVSFQVFYDELLPYGDWISDPVHGYVWVPYAGPDFQPYASNGYWVMSTYGNTWVSNYDWGWAPFHYGRWYFDDYLGWAWVPGYEWGPAWVNWRTGGDYYGWAPLLPGLGIHVSVNIPSNYWVFVPKRRIVSRNVYNYYIPRKNVYRIYNQTTIINNTYVYNNNTYVSGPARREVERVTRRSVPVYQVNNSNKAGRTSVSRNTVQVYQPSIRQSANTARESQARPSRVVSANEHKANLATRSSSSRSAANTRTAPASSRDINSRATENNRGSQVNTRQQEPTRGAATVNGNKSRTGTPSNNTRTVSPQRQTEAQPQPTRQPGRVNSSGPATRSPSTVNPTRTQTSPQRSGNPAMRTQDSQPSRQSTTRTQEVKRNTSTPKVAPISSSRQSSNGNATRSSSTSRSSSRGNN